MADPEKDGSRRGGASSGMNLTRFDSLMDAIFQGPHADDGRARIGGARDSSGTIHLPRLMGVGGLSDTRSAPQSPWLSGAGRPPFSAHRQEGHGESLLSRSVYPHHGNHPHFVVARSHVGSESGPGATVPGALYASPNTNYGAVGPAQVSVHYHMGYPMLHPGAPMHGATGNFGAMASLMALADMPHAEVQDVTRVGTNGSPLPGSDADGSSNKMMEAAEARAARTRKLRARRNERQLNVGTTLTSSSPQNLDDPTNGEKPPTRRRGRRAKTATNREERRIRNRASVQLCRHKKKQKFEGLDQEKELQEKEHAVMAEMCKRHEQFVSELRNLIPPQVLGMYEDVVAFVNTPPRNRRADFDE